MEKYGLWAQQILSPGNEKLMGSQVTSVKVVQKSGCPEVVIDQAAVACSVWGWQERKTIPSAYLHYPPMADNMSHDLHRDDDLYPIGYRPFVR